MPHHRHPAVLGLVSVLLLWLAGSLALRLVLPGPAAGSDAAVAAGQLAPGGDAGRGRELYLQNCATCHGQQGQGSQRGPRLIGVGAASADFQLSTGRMPLREGERRGRRRPPAFDQRDIAALVAYVASLGPGQSVPQVDPDSGDLVRGRELYQQNCSACHSATGAGAALTSGQVAPSLGAATATQIAEAIRLGPTAMPSFDPDTLSDRDVDSIARYVAYTRAAGDRGGQGLGRIGPITEGLVGWAIGLGLLILVIRRIGKRAGET